jgi:hypothetical protein
VSDGFDEVYFGTRRQLRGVAESLIAGPPHGVYDIVDPLPTDGALDIDAVAADWIRRSHCAGRHAIKNVLPEQRPVLWPEHFDVAAAAHDVDALTVHIAAFFEMGRKEL